MIISTKIQQLTKPKEISDLHHQLLLISCFSELAPLATVHMESLN